MPVYPKAAPPSRVVRGEEPQGLFRAVKGAFHDLVSSSCTSGKNGTGGGRWKPAATPPEKPLVQPRRVGTRWRIPHEPDVLGGPGKHSRHLWVWLGQRYHTRRGATQPSRHARRERARPPMQRPTSGHQGRHRRKRVGYPTQQRPQSEPIGTPPAAECLRGENLHLGEALTVILRSPLTPPDAVPPRFCARTNARSRQRQRDPAMFDTAESIAQLRDGHVPTRRTWNHPRKLPQRAERPDTWGSDRDRPEAPEIDRTPETHGW